RSTLCANRLASPANAISDGLERGVSVLAQCRNGGDANDDNEGQHHSVFDSRRAIFTLQKVHETFQHGKYSQWVRLISGSSAAGSAGSPELCQGRVEHHGCKT